MIGMAHDLGYRVVAEGIEAEEGVALLAEWGCDEAQGYYFAKPLSVGDMEAWLEARNAAG
jgi:EAL domain-containing protein (putative c-di-GMP-specific phosphodiesterase class I)